MAATEIDAPETLGRNPNMDYLSNHSGPNDEGFTTTAYDAGVDLADDYHTYGMMWDPNNITWYLDGQVVAQTPTLSDEHKPFYVILDPMGMGDCGDGWGDCPEDGPSFKCASTFGADAFVDYVRVWQFSDQNPAACIGDCTGISSVPTSSSGTCSTNGSGTSSSGTSSSGSRPQAAALRAAHPALQALADRVAVRLLVQARAAPAAAMR